MPLFRLRRALLRVLITMPVMLALAAAPARADLGGPYGMHSLLQLNSTFAMKQAMFAAAAGAQAAEIRVDASLGALNNPWISAAMWHGLDEYEWLSYTYHVPVLLDLNASNDIALESCPAGADPSTGVCGIDPTKLDGYYAEVAAVVRHVRGFFDDFEIVNEPDGWWAFEGTPQQYAGMLATAYRAVHDNDPNGRVLLGGIMSPSDTSWLTSVFTTPGFDAAQSFDIANVHLRDTVSDLPGDIAAWKRYFAFFGDGQLPLWVTETGYPADPTYQFDPSFRGTDTASGEAAQAAFITAALPALIQAGAARVFVTERDDLAGPYASEGLLGGAVTDADQNAPNPVPRPAYSAFAALVAQALQGIAPTAPESVPQARPAAPPPAPPQRVAPGPPIPGAAPAPTAPVAAPRPTAQPPAAPSAQAPAAAARRPAGSRSGPRADAPRSRAAAQAPAARHRHRRHPSRRRGRLTHRPRAKTVAPPGEHAHPAGGNVHPQG